MIKKRIHIPIIQGNLDILHRNILESESCPLVGNKSDLIRKTMLKQIAEDPTLLRCGPLDFEILKMAFQQDKWVIETQATERKNLPA